MTYPDEGPFEGSREQDRPDFTTTPSSSGESQTASFSTVPAGQSGSTTEQTKEVASHTGDRARDVAGTAKQEAGAVKDTAVEAGSHVVESAKAEAAGVMEEAKYESRRVFDEGMRELRVQAGAGQNHLAGFVRSLSGELGSMGNSTDQSGPMVDLVRSLERYGRDAADWLEYNEPEEVLDSVRRYAARKPWAFLAISAGVGLVGARLVRGLQGAKSDEDDRLSASRRYDTPARASYSTGAGTTPTTYGTGYGTTTGATGGTYPSQPTTGIGAGQYPSQPSTGSGYVEGYPPPGGGASSGGATTQNPMPGQGYPPSSPQGGQGTRPEDLR